MKLKLLYTVPAFALLMACGNGKVETKFDNGQIKESYTEVKDAKGELVKHGIFEAFDEKGQIRDSVNYVMGKREGLEVKYYDNGKKMYACTWQANVANGRNEEFNTDGKLIKVTTLKQGVPDGAEIDYTPAGVKLEEKYFKDGIQDSIHMRWNEKGDLKMSTTFKMGKRNGVEMQFCEEDKYKEVKRDSVQFVDGKRQGTEVYHICLNGELSSIMTWKDDKMDGPYTYWEENKKVVETYKMGVCTKNCPKPPAAQ